MAQVLIVDDSPTEVHVLKTILDGKEQTLQMG